MKQLSWMSVAMLTLAVAASPGAAEFGPFRIWPCQPRLGAPCPTPAPIPPSLPPTPKTPDSTPPTTPDATTPDFSGAGEFKGTAGRTNSVVAGTGIGAAVTGDPVLTGVFSPLILPGLFTTAVGQSAVPVDRIYFDYGYFNGVQVRGVGTSAPMLNQTPISTITFKNVGSPSFPVRVPVTTTTIHNSVSQSADPVSGFNLNTFNIGIEKTFLDGLASFYVSVPFLYATDNISGQQIDGLSDVNLGFKAILYQSLGTGNTLTGGFTISFPTAHPAISTSYMQTGNGTGNALVPSTSISVNPTYFQPWVAGLLIFDRLFVHEYFSVVIPSDQRVATQLNSDLTIGYALFRNGTGLVSSMTPMMGVQALIPVSQRGTTPDGQGSTSFVPFNADGSLPAPPPPNPFTFTDQVFISGGLQLGLGSRWTFSGNLVVPVAGPRGYNIGATFSLNYFY